MTREESAWFLTTLLNIVRDNSVKTINVKKTPRFEESIEKAIDALTEPKTGKWIEHEWAEEYDGLLISNYECTNCHSWERNNTDFCPNCGADMRGEEE